MDLKPGQMTALVGPSGEGKSTCVSLLERLYEPQDGEIFLDGEPLKSYDHHFFHKKVFIHSSFSAYAILDVSLDLVSDLNKLEFTKHI